MTDERDPFAPPPEVEPTFGVAPTFVEVSERSALAQRDPHAPADESAEFPITGAVSFDDVLRRARWQGFAAGAAAGAVAGAVLAAVIAVAVSRGAGVPSAVAPAIVAEIPAAAPASAEPWPTTPLPRRTGRVAAAPAASAPAAAPGSAPAPSAIERAIRRAAAEPAVVEDQRPAASPAALETSGQKTAEHASAAEAAAPAAADAPPAPTPDAAAPAARPPKPTDVVAALAERRAALDACIADMPGDDDAARGRRFRILVVVEPTGRVSEARAYDDAIAATRLGTCLVKLAQDLSFPPFDGEAARLEVPIRADDAP